MIILSMEISLFMSPMIDIKVATYDAYIFYKISRLDHMEW